MKTGIALPDDENVKIDTGDHDHPVMIRRSLMEKTTNRAGVEMWKYKYWKIEANEVYRVSEPDEYQRIVKALANPDVRFVYIGKDFVNINQIKTIKEKVGYKRIEK